MASAVLALIVPRGVSGLLCSCLLYAFLAGKMLAADMEECIWSHHTMCMQPHISAAIVTPEALPRVSICDA